VRLDLNPQLFPLVYVDTWQKAGTERTVRRFTAFKFRYWRKRTMVKKIALAALIALTFLPAASYAQVVVRIGPPPPVVEHRPPPPDHGYVWIAGYQRWDGARYVWSPGRWDRPPHPGAHWVSHRWVHHHDHWELQEGHWR
jgi:hypothetical protein